MTPDNVRCDLRYSTRFANLLAVTNVGYQPSHCLYPTPVLSQLGLLLHTLQCRVCTSSLASESRSQVQQLHQLKKPPASAVNPGVPVPADDACVDVEHGVAGKTALERLVLPVVLCRSCSMNSMHCSNLHTWDTSMMMFLSALKCQTCMSTASAATMKCTLLCYTGAAVTRQIQIPSTGCKRVPVSLPIHARPISRISRPAVVHQQQIV